MIEAPAEGLIITVGCPGSGKSTWADANIPDTALRLERDRFRECLFGSRRGYHESPLSPSARSAVITESMLAAMEKWPNSYWAVSDTGLFLPSVRPFMLEAFEQDASCMITLVVFDRPWEYLLEVNRNRLTEHRVPEDILEDMFNAFNKPDAWWREPHRRRIEVPLAW